MRTTLISFLGRPQKKEGSYQKTRYTFADGEQTEPMAFLGWALRERFSPDRLVILGTAGSMWDHLFEGDLDFGSHADTERMALMESVENQSVTQAQLDMLSPVLAQKLGCEVQLLLIPYARNEAEQVAILQIIAQHVEEQDVVHLDVTHGFRHLPMIALLAAFFLRMVRRATMAGIWYGSYDPDTKEASVLDLSGLLRIGEGIQALASFDKDGDYRVFVPILEAAGLSRDTCQALTEAAYYENILNVGAATGKLRAVFPLRNQAEGLRPDATLFLPAIEERLDWIQASKQFSKQIELSKLSLARRDYLRSVLYAYESCITRLCQLANVPVQNFKAREELRNFYEEYLYNHRGPERERYMLLKNLRNQVAHGTRGSTEEVQKALLNESVMEKTVPSLLAEIEADRLPGAGFQEEWAKLKAAAIPAKTHDDNLLEEDDDDTDLLPEKSS